VLDAIVRDLEIFEAWSDEEWSIEGAAVRVSLVCFAKQGSKAPIRLNGKHVSLIHSDLTAVDEAGNLNITLAKRLKQNFAVGFVGTVKAGKFDIPEQPRALGWASP